MTFLEFCNSGLGNVLLESMQPSDIVKLYSEISTLEKQYRAKDKPTFKNELKKLKKGFISKLVKENHKSIMDKFFPFLKKNRFLSDDDFLEAICKMLEKCLSPKPIEFLINIINN